MMEYVVLGIAVLISGALSIWILFKSEQDKKEFNERIEQSHKEDGDLLKSLFAMIEENKNPKVDVGNLEQRLNATMAKIPEQVTNSITGSANAKKGKVGELIGYIQLKAEYDRLIPFGSITDFIGIKFKTPQSDGYVDFIDIKTGKNAKLTTDQKGFKEVLDKKNIRFRTVKITDDKSNP